MDKLLSDKYKPEIVGLFQALGVIAYAALIAGFFFFMEGSRIQPGYLGIVMMLVLLVFSAGITGTFVFGLPAYFALKNDINRAISLLAYTFVYIFLALIVTALIILTLY